MNDRHLRNFIVIVQAGSFPVAAEKLHISTQALHQQMDILEREIGCKLLHRGRIKTTLTDAGTVFFKGIDSVLLGLDHLVFNTRSASNVKDNTIMLYGNAWYNDIVYSHAVQALIGAYPEIRIKIHSYISPQEVVSNPDAIDVFVGNAEDYPCFIQSHYLCALPLCAIFQANHPLAKLNCIQVEQLLPYELKIQSWKMFETECPEMLYWLKKPEVQVELLPPSEQGSHFEYVDFNQLTSDAVHIVFGPAHRLSSWQIQRPIEHFSVPVYIMTKPGRMRPALGNYIDFITNYYHTHGQKILNDYWDKLYSP